MEALKASALYCGVEICCHFIFYFVSVLTVFMFLCSVLLCFILFFVSYSAFMLFLHRAVKKKHLSFIYFSHSRLFSCASNHFGRRLETGEIHFVMADCVILLAHPETQMATLVSAVGWLSVDFTHRSLTITEGCFFLASAVNTPRI